MAKLWSPKDPTDIRDYRIDWTEFLPADDPITDSILTLPDELELVADSHTATTVEFRVGGGEVGGSYDIDNTITTSTGQVFNLTATLKIAERVVK